MAKRAYYRTKQINRRKHRMGKNVFRKTTSLVLSFFVVFQTIAGIFLPMEITLTPPYVKLQETKAAAGDWYNSSWTYRKKITIDYTKVGATLANFAVLISVTDASLKDTANGGHVTQSDGGDILFTNLAGTKLDHEIEKYTASTGALVAWVEVDSLSSSANTDIYIYYGGPTTPDQWNMNGTWDEGGTASIKIVQHLQETDIDGGAGDIKDSTSNANNGATSGMDASDQVAGKVDGSFDFDGTNDYVNIGNQSTLNFYDSFTLLAWIKTTATSERKVINKFDAYNGLGYSLSSRDDGKVWFGMHGSGTWKCNFYSDKTVNDGLWHQIVGVREKGNQCKIYIDGGLDKTASDDGSAMTYGAYNFYIGRGYDSRGGGYSQYYWNGTIDEVRAYNRTLSVYEITTRYNNQNSPSTFYTLGAEEYLDHFTITGTGAMNAGTSQVITITAKTNLGATYTGYTGDKSLTFSGASISGGGNNPTCSDKTSADVNFGTAITITFTSGIATSTMKLYAAESISIDVTDGTVNSTADPSYDLDVVVSSPLSGTSIQINSNDAYTISKDTTLTLSATSASWMKFSNDNSAYSAYEAYGVSKSWDITNATYGGTSSEGAKTVYAKYKDAYGNESAAVSDNIVYDITSPTNPSSAIDAQGAVSDTWQNNKNDPNFTSFTGESDTNGIAGFYVYFGTDVAGVTADWIAADAFDPASFATSSARYLRVIAKDNPGNWADPDGTGTACPNTNASRPADPDCWATIFIHKYDIDAPYTPSPVSSPASWTNANSFNFSWSDPGDVGGSGVKDYTYQTNAGTSPTITASTSVNGLTSDSNGTKLFSVKANDNAGNSSANGTVNFYYDNTAPANAGAATDGNGSLDDAWGTVSDPNFTWVAGADTGDQSGVKEYDVYWGTSVSGATVTATVATNAYNPSAIPANTPYYLRIRTRDNALNESAWATKFTMKYSQAASSPSGLSQSANSASLAFGDWTNDTTPTLNFTLSDPDSDTLGYIIKIDDTANFSSPIVHYTYSANDLISGQEYSFTVGQAAGTGSYTVGNAGQILSEGQYYWKIQAVESHGLASSEVTANSGAVAFGIDTSNPTGTTLGFGTVAIDSITASVSGSADSVSGLHSAPYYFENTTAAINSGWQAGTSWISGSLTANTRYTFKVTARDKAGNTEETATQSKYTLASQVTGLTASNATDKSSCKINLTWTNQSQSGMKIEQDANCDGYETTLYDNISSNPSSPYSVSVSANTCYRFRISSYNGDGILNTTSIPETSQITSPPAQPGGLTHTANTINSISWDWNDVSGATGYKVYNSSDDALLATVATATSSWDQSSLSADTLHTIYVRAVNADGEGIASSSASAYTSANVPVSPSHSANATDSITWTWASGGAQKDYYAWNVSPADNSGWIVLTNWTQSSLSANTSYTFNVKARNESPDLDETNSVSNSAYTSQNAPTGISFDDVAADSITLSAAGTLSNLTSGSSGLYFLNTTNSDTPDWIQTNSWTNSSLTPNTQYSYKVKARNGDGDQTSYTAESAKYTLANAPSAPTLSTPTSSSLKLVINQNSNSSLTNYSIQETTASKYLQVDGILGVGEVYQTYAEWGGTSGITITGLSSNTQYTFKIKAKNGEDIATAFSSTASLYTSTADAPTNFQVQTYNPTSLILTVDSFINDNIDQAGYLFMNTTNSNTSGWIQTNSWTDNGLTPNTAYSYAVKYKNAEGIESSAASLAAVTLANIPSGLNLSVNLSNNQIAASWSANSNPASTEYYLENTTNSANSGWITGSSWTSPDLLCGTDYSFRIKAKNSQSAETSFTSISQTRTNECGGGLPSSIFNPPASPASSSSNPEGKFSVIINNGDEYATSEIVNLKLYAGKDTTKMAISNTPDFKNASQIPYQEEMEWELSECRRHVDVSPSDICVVYAKFYTQYGVASEAVSDSIILDAVPPEIKTSHIDSFLSDQDIIITGFTEPEAKVGIKLDDSFAGMPPIFADSTGYFSFNLGHLSAGSHTLDIRGTDSAGNMGEAFSLNLMVKKPELAVSPKSKPAPTPALPEAPIPIPIPIPTTSVPPAPIPAPGAPAAPAEIPSSPTSPSTPSPTPSPVPQPLNPDWNLLPAPKLKEFPISFQPSEISFFTQKFPSLEKTFEKLGISQIADISSDISSVSFNLPNLEEILNIQSPKDIANQVKPLQPTSLVDLPAKLKEKIPSEIAFISAYQEKINLNSSLVLDEGYLKQKISAPPAENLNIAIKPDGLAKSISGYIALKSKKISQVNSEFANDKFLISNYSNQIPNLNNRNPRDLNIGHLGIGHSLGQLKIRLIRNFEVLLAYAFSVPSSFAQESKSQEIKTRFVLAQFQYSDPNQDGIWTANVQTPAVVGEYEIISTINYQDPKIPAKEIRLIAMIDPEGYAYERIKNQELRITNAVVYLYYLNPQTNQYELWPAKDYDQQNPQTTDTTGKYSFLVPEGTYYLKAEALGYLAYQSEPFQVKEGSGIHVNIELKTKYWRLKVIDWKTALLVAVTLLLLYNFYKDRIREKLMRKS